jgi:uncharacterized membrane protein
MSSWRRWLRHLTTGRAIVARHFPRSVLGHIEAAVKACESRHAGEIRFAVEAALHPSALLAGATPRARAVEVFSQLRVWDTEHNNGVLIYLLLADRAVEIVADRGVAGGRVPQGEWDAVCRLMEERFRGGDFERGAVAGINAVADLLARYPPGPPRGGNELADAPVLLS